MKRDKQRKVHQDVDMEIAGVDASQMNEHSGISKIRDDPSKMHEETKNHEPLYQDKVMNELAEGVVYLNDFAEFP